MTPVDQDWAVDKDSRIYLAYDGSINADWVSRYAIRAAANSASKKILLFHVLDGSYSPEEIRLKIEALENECTFQHVELASELLPLKKNVYQTILTNIPANRASFCFCGARITSRGRGFLAGTISEKILRAGRFNVMAIRVVHPGLLGCPGDILLPLTGKAYGLEGVMPFFLLLAPDIRNVHLIKFFPMSPWILRYSPDARIKAMRHKGRGYLKNLIVDMQQYETVSAIHFDGRVVFAKDWVKETLIKANQLRARLILLESTSRSLPARIFFGAPIERILRATPCDVAICRTI
ncbi:MAG: universal stress protein [Desulfobulbaceae bacterium]|nr:universal stress protein [Desulfobulbaceae bacterium]